MGNRALIIMEKPMPHQPMVPAIYVHWNGGIESVKAICEICKERGFRTPSGDASYAFARMVGVWHEFFGIDSSISLGVFTYDGSGDAGDNGVYVVGEEWRIIEHYLHHWDTGEKIPLPLELKEDWQVKQYEGILEGMAEQLAGFLEVRNKE